MKALFGVLGLLVVLVIVGSLARKQWVAVGPHGPVASEPATTVRQQSEQTQQRVLQDVNKALELGASRASEADK